jgi:hypothetical protein
MKLRQTLLFILLSVVLLIAGGCAPESQTEPHTTPTIDEPYLSAQEAIAIAQQEAVNLEYNVVAALARSSQKDWHATYIGEGKWTADFYYGANIYRWTVFEKTLTAVYIGAFTRE